MTGLKTFSRAKPGPHNISLSFPAILVKVTTRGEKAVGRNVFAGEDCFLLFWISRGTRQGRRRLTGPGIRGLLCGACGLCLVFCSFLCLLQPGPPAESYPICWDGL